MDASKNIYWKKVVFIFVFGLVGILSALPMIPKLVATSGQEAPMPIGLVQAISTLQSSVILFAMVMLGAWSSPKVNLGAPILDSYLRRSFTVTTLKPILTSALVGGILGGMLILLFYQFSKPYLPTEFLENVEDFTPPLYTKIFYGGITEEILIRWGLMSFFVWGAYRLTQSKGAEVRAYNYITGILLSAIIFGVGHLPAATILSPVLTGGLVLYIIIGNSIFGIIAGYLYWKRGLEAAIIAHITAHTVMTLGEKIA